MRWWELDRFGSGVPAETESDRALRILQPFLAVGFAIVAIAAIRPMGLTGAGGIRLLLIVACALLLLTIPIPDSVIRPRGRVVIATLVAVPAGLLMGLAGQGWGGTFAYMLGVHAGIRFPLRTAIRVISLDVGLGVVASLAWAHTPGNPWWANLLVYLGLIPGVTRRARQITLASAHEVVEQTHRAAALEAESRALAERAAIAREIHDVLAHSLSGVNMQLSLADALFDSGQEERGRQAVRTAQSLVVTGLDEARAAVQTLRGDTVDPVVAIGRMTTGDHESWSVVGTPYPLPSRAVHAVIRIAQESITNARRHAAGASLNVRLIYAADSVMLEVCNGPGQSDHEGSGLGLVGMRERAASIDAVLDAGPLPDGEGGWRVRLEIPRDDA